MLLACLITAGSLVGVVIYGLRPTLYRGDRWESRSCRRCGGQDPLCVTCDGEGVVRVIVPGPNRPTLILGEVFDPEARRRVDEPAVSNAVWGVTEGGLHGEEARGVVPEAVLTFAPVNGRSRETRTSSRGRFLISLKAGIYRVNVERRGYQPLVAELAIPEQTNAIWVGESGRGASFYLSIGLLRAPR